MTREGHARIPAEHVETFDGDDIKVADWAVSRRNEYRKGTLSAERIADLKAVPGWEWDRRKAVYERGLAAVRQFVTREGHARIPVKHVETFDSKEIKLGSWASARRGEYRKGTLSAERRLSRVLLK